MPKVGSKKKKKLSDTGPPLNLSTSLAPPGLENVVAMPNTPEWRIMDLERRMAELEKIVLEHRPMFTSSTTNPTIAASILPPHGSPPPDDEVPF